MGVPINITLMLSNQKTSAQSSRFQVRPRRRRQCKTDYKQRRALTSVPKNKYASLKYRFVVRQTNTQVICAFVLASLEGDLTIASATSKDLPNFGIKVGLKNASAFYACGLLAARRLLSKLKLDTAFVANNKFGEDAGESMTEREPIEACLDVGLARLTRGRKVMTALKGAIDGGVHIPHSPHQFPGYDAAKECQVPTLHRDRIYGKHVADYMREMQAENVNKYEIHFGDYIKEGIKADNIEAMYTKAFEAIIKNPQVAKKTPKAVTNTLANNMCTVSDGNKYPRCVRLTRDQRRARVDAKLAQIASITAANKK